MDMQKKIISMVVVLVAVVCFYLYVLIFASAIRFENNKALMNQGYFTGSKNDGLLLKPVPAYNDSWLNKAILHNPAETELYLRSKLLTYQNISRQNVVKLKVLYNMLIQSRPTWSYYYSGLVQLSMIDRSLEIRQLELAMKYGKHERKVIKSLAEILFYNWNRLDNKQRNELLEYLSEQTDSSIAGVVNISAKFARIYEYCDFIYDKKQVEYAACKNQYWQPLSDIQ